MDIVNGARNKNVKNDFFLLILLLILSMNRRFKKIIFEFALNIIISHIIDDIQIDGERKIIDWFSSNRI